ncbi:tRNA adenosine(34) deaminase TadA [Desulfobulbus elongatus]|uniref:tRNA adenosine(34) deaminase TadA n=1 Tax=Desulfobulbus elongatus TaxID=53332 RepID=UPI0004860404|nr:tRNA adenosine(34) deaminase TadA [Desulfobulbus elongatus]
MLQSPFCSCNPSGQDYLMMARALVQARRSADAGEVPVGAVVVTADGTILAESGNNCIAAADPSGHAEMRALRQAAQVVGNYRLPGVTVYVTLEPCPMCAALLVHARIGRLVFGALDPKGGGVVSKYRIGGDGLLNHQFVTTAGVCAEECGRVLQEFFRNRR